jgi:hypothetical protein
LPNLDNTNKGAASVDPLFYVYDLEVYPNLFTFSLKHPASGQRWLYEISDRRDDRTAILQTLDGFEQAGVSMVGFNNLHYDYSIIHYLRENPYCDNKMLRAKNDAIIFAPRGSFAETVSPWNVRIKQIDLYKIHHFDNQARRTSLKALEYAMNMSSIQDLPFPPDTILTSEQMDTVIAYNHHDVDATERFLLESLPAINLRDELSEKYGADFTNYNDTKIGKEYFIMRLEEESPGCCWIKEPGKRRIPRQTIRPTINLGDAVFDYITFERPEFDRILKYFKSTTIKETKGVFNDLSATVDGFQYDFGTGGIHGSISSQTVHTDGEKVIVDLDVASYYPNLAIANRCYPEHLGETFCRIYADVYEQRKQYKKNTPENKMLKLALNGVYGDSNNVHSPFYDPLYTMKITINGQLLLCVLAEQLLKIPGLEMIQVNTDGLTVRCPYVGLPDLQSVRSWWERFTCLELEEAVYSRMFIRDVNNYIAEYADGGKLKRKGAYEYESLWHQDPSQKVVAKVAEKALVEGVNIESTVRNWPDDLDFFCRAKVRRSDRLMCGDTELQRISRYYVSINGGTLVRHSPPAKGNTVGAWKRRSGLSDSEYHKVLEEIKTREVLKFDKLDALGIPWDERIHTKNQSKYTETETNMKKGRLVTICNDTTKIDRSNLDYEYYISEVQKLVEPLQS